MTLTTTDSVSRTTSDGDNQRANPEVDDNGNQLDDDGDGIGDICDVTCGTGQP